MARVKSIINLTGTVGGINFYNRNGKPVARAAGGGFNGKAIKTKKSMVRVRENASEFGRCSSLKRVYQRSLAPFYRDYKDGGLHGRLMQLFTELKNLDPVSARGERYVGRGLETTPGRVLFSRFAYSPECRIADRLHMQFDMDWNNWHLQTQIDEPERIPFPQGASHVELTFGVLVFDFNEMTAAYSTGDRMVFEKGTFPSSHTFTAAPLPNASGTRLAFFGMRFYDDVGGKPYYFKQAESFGLELVDVAW